MLTTRHFMLSFFAAAERLWLIARTWHHTQGSRTEKCRQRTKTHTHTHRQINTLLTLTVSDKKREDV